jgi:hypothetical protein
MRTRIFLAIIFVLAATWMFISCRPSHPKEESAEELLKDKSQTEDLLDSLFIPSDDNKFTSCVNCGVEVDTAFVHPCLDSLIKIMKDHGFDSTKHAVDIRILETTMMTTWEEFRGRELMHFLKKAAIHKRLIGGGAICGVRIALGIYTKAYIDKYGSPEKLGRIGIFLLTTTRKKNRVSASRNPFADINDADDSTGFDFGGIHP